MRKCIKRRLQPVYATVLMIVATLRFLQLFSSSPSKCLVKCPLESEKLDSGAANITMCLYPNKTSNIWCIRLL